MITRIKKHIIFSISALLLFCTVSAHAKETDDDSFERYNNTSFNFTMLLPVGWSKEEIDLTYSTVLLLSKKRETEIKITFSKTDRDEEIKWKNWKDWYTEGIGSGLKEIVDQDNITIGKNINGRLLVFEFYSKGRRLLQRIMIARYNNKQVVIECGSPVNLFYKHNDTFDTLMKSIEIINKTSYK